LIILVKTTINTPHWCLLPSKRVSGCFTYLALFDRARAWSPRNRELAFGVHTEFEVHVDPGQSHVLETKNCWQLLMVHKNLTEEWDTKIKSIILNKVEHKKQWLHQKLLSWLVKHQAGGFMGMYLYLDCPDIEFMEFMDWIGMICFGWVGATNNF